jgi:hypothetical protein
MPEPVDEDLIEATIRRVAEAKAARQQDSSPTAEPPSAASGRRKAKNGPDEDAIEATIRRVQEQKAASERGGTIDPLSEDNDDEATAAGVALTAEVPSLDAEGPSLLEPDVAKSDVALDEDAITATIRRVQEQKVAAEAAEAGAPSTATQAHDGPDEDAIAATIRRVQEQKAAADAAAAAESAAEYHHEPPDEDAIAATIRRVREQKRALELRYDDEDDDATIAPASGAASDDATVLASAIAASERAYDPESFEPVSEVTYSDDVIARLERNLREAHHAIAALSARVEALERAADLASPAAVTPFPSRGDAWEEEHAKVAASAGFGTPARSPILRDPAPVPAVRPTLVEQPSEPQLIDTRPLPKPLPPIHVEPKRGLDLLPRTYRITVEDKRRGVDLVPLHRALLSMEGVKDMSLLSYNNGVAIVALETTGDLDTDGLGAFVSRAMSRAAKVEQHNEHTFVVKLAED